MTDTPIRLLLADDHPVVRAGLRAVLETESDFTIVAEAATAEEAVTLAGELDIDVVLMDLQFGRGMNGSQATAAITARPGAPRVLVVTTYDTDADTLPAIEAGATGYLLKDAPPEELAAAVRTAAAGRTTLAPTVADRLMNRLRTPYRPDPPRDGNPRSGRRRPVQSAHQRPAQPHPGHRQVPPGPHLRQARRRLPHRRRRHRHRPRPHPPLTAGA